MNRPASIVSLAAACVLGSCIVAASARADETAPPPRTIRVSGQHVVKMAPDRARVSLSVVSRAPNAREASETNAATSKAVLDKLRAAVKAPGEVRTASYDLTPEYDYNQQRTGARHPSLIGYVATNHFAIVTADLPGVGALIDAAVAAGANQIESIGFFLDDEESARRQALLEAGKKARAEAETIAQSLAISLGEVLDASSSSSGPPPPIPLGRERMAYAMDSAAASTEAVPGSLDISAAVSVTFAIR